MHHFHIFKSTLSIVSRYVQMQGSKTIPGVLKVCSPDQQQTGIFLQMQILGPHPNYYGNSGGGAQQSVFYQTLR